VLSLFREVVFKKGLGELESWMVTERHPRLFFRAVDLALHSTNKFEDEGVLCDADFTRTATFLTQFLKRQPICLHKCTQLDMVVGSIVNSSPS
jgi:hypothetical protein